MLNNAIPAKDGHVLIPGTHASSYGIKNINKKEGVVFRGSIKSRIVKMERSFWATWVPPKCSHTYPSTIVAEEYFTPAHTGTTEATWPQATDRRRHGRPEEAWTGPPRPAHTWTWAR